MPRSCCDYSLGRIRAQGSMRRTIPSAHLSVLHITAQPGMLPLGTAVSIAYSRIHTTADSATSKLQVKSEAIRVFVLCVECEKPRCLLSAKKLTNERTAQLSAAVEGMHYVCGGPLYQHDHLLVSVAGARSDFICNSDVIPHYFFYQRAFPQVCHACGDKHRQLIPQALAQKHQSVHTQCTSCLEKGVKHRTKDEKRPRCNFTCSGHY